MNKPNHLPDGSQTQAPLLAEEEVEPIRVIKPERLSENLQNAILSAKDLAIELSAGETDGKANTGMFTAYLNNIPEAKFTSAILVHECLIQPNYKGKALTAIFRTSEEQAVAKLLYHVRQLVNISVFDVWSAYLYHAGQSAGLLRKPRSAGDVDLLLLDLDAEAWTRLITGGLANGVIQLPVNTGEIR